MRRNRRKREKRRIGREGKREEGRTLNLKVLRSSALFYFTFS